MNFELKKAKGKIATLIVFAFLVLELVGIPIAFSVSAESTLKAANLEVGKYVSFGQYGGQKILWRIINKDVDNNIMLFSEYMLSMKSFSSLESQIEGSDRHIGGSNDWETSDIRAWLNSAEKSGQVVFANQKPDAAHVADKISGYDTESGFLNGFSSLERNFIVPVSRKVVLSQFDSAKKDGGSEPHVNNYNIKECVQNYDTSAFYKNIKDNVFFLSTKELNEYVYKRGFEYKKKLEPNGIFTVFKVPANMIPTTNLWYWLSDPSSIETKYVKVVLSTGEMSKIEAMNTVTGVAPALYLKAQSPIYGGAGSIEKPYEFSSNGTSNEANKTIQVEQAIENKTDKSYSVEINSPVVNMDIAPEIIKNAVKENFLLKVETSLAKVEIPYEVLNTDFKINDGENLNVKISEKKTMQFLI